MEVAIVSALGALLSAGITGTFAVVLGQKRQLDRVEINVNGSLAKALIEITALRDALAAARVADAESALHVIEHPIPATIHTPPTVPLVTPTAPETTAE